MSEEVADSPASRICSWGHGKPSGPWYVNVFPTNRCNLHCAMCWQRGVEYSREDVVPDTRFLHFVDECAELGAKHWCFAGGGEPLLRGPLVMDMCERIRGHGMNGTIVTNGLSFGSEYLEHLASIGWAKVGFSVDGTNEEMNDTVRSKGAFRKATECIREAAQWRRDNGVKLPEFSIHTTVNTLNVDHLTQIAEMARELGCEEVSVAEINMHGDFCKPFALSEDQTARMPEWIDAAAERARELGLEENYHRMLAGTPKWKQRFVREPVDLPVAPCYEPWLNVTVHADGRISPCCVAWDADAPILQEVSLREVWEGPMYERFRASLVGGDYLEACLVCPPPPSLYARDLQVREEVALLRENEVWGKRPHHWLGLPAHVLAKAVQSLRRHGLRSALRRGREWLYLFAKHHLHRRE